uniref:Xyloglucan:xyloglucosyl transferase n=1 Tax=Steinernema glaseri TaxID=37863 RepID=A0A1I8AH33_9BILA
MMLLSAFLLLLLSQACYSAAPLKRMTKHFLFVQLKVFTRDQNFFGTNANASARIVFGFVNETSNRLVHYHNVNYKVPETGRFKRHHMDDLRYYVGGSIYADVEQACSSDATDQYQYEACMTEPNVVFIILHSMYDLWKPWKLDQIQVKVTLVNPSFKEGWFTEASGTSTFLPRDKWLTNRNYFRASNGGELRKVHEIPVPGPHFGQILYQ